MTTPERGDRFVWQEVVAVEVLRVARDGSWADISCSTGTGRSWRKRQKLPLSNDFRSAGAK